MSKSRFKILPELESFGQNYIKTINERAILQGAIFIDGKRNEVRIWYFIPQSKTEKEKWGCALIPYNK